MAQGAAEGDCEAGAQPDAVQKKGVCAAVFSLGLSLPSLVGT